MTNNKPTHLSSREYPLADEQATVALGEALGRACELGIVMYLEGTLGAGKTTLTRGVLRSAGHSGPVKSPTYTLVEVYEFAEKTVCHFDLYRLSDPEELEYMGIRDYFSKQNVLVIEWPNRGEGILPGADINIIMHVNGQGRLACLNALTPIGQRVLQRLNASGE